MSDIETVTVPLYKYDDLRKAKEQIEKIKETLNGVEIKEHWMQSYGPNDGGHAHYETKAQRQLDYYLYRVKVIIG